MHEPAILPDRGAPQDAPSRRVSIPVLLLALLILTYAAFFSAYTLQRHATLNTFAADLSFIDQPMWNTVHGRFLERTLGAVQAPRVAEHFEPILLPLSLIYLVWDDVRAMLILQSVVLALGALPVFWIARRAFKDHGRRGEWIALAFSLAYLLAPSLQAANIADFHADPLIVTPCLLAFWYATERRWRPMWAWAIVVIAGKENMATLTAMLGLYLVVSGHSILSGAPSHRKDPSRRKGPSRRKARSRRMRPLPTALSAAAKHGLALFLVSIAWFAVATFLIVAPLARQYYGTSGPIYFASRYAFHGIGDTLSGLLTALREPVRLAYLGGLFAAVGWLAILAPEYLLLGLPILVANTFSNFVGQYSGEQHYTAPLVPVFIVAAIYGLRRLQTVVGRWNRPRLRWNTVAAAAGAVWLLVWAGSAQVERGWTPLSRLFVWPAYTAHHATLARLTAQIPADAPVSATPAVHAHLAHREKIYVYPEVGDATYVLLDVAGVTDMQASDLKASVDRLLSGRQFGVVDAADGFLLLAKGRGTAAMPADFYTFARANASTPQFPIEAQFGPGLQFLGYDVINDARWRLTRFRFYFKRLSEQPLPADLAIRYTARDPGGALVDDSTLRPMTVPLWLPPQQWEQGQVVALETTAWFLPRAFAPLLTVTSGGQTVRPELRPQTAAVAPDGSLRLPGFARRGGQVGLYEDALYPIQSATASFAGEGWAVRLDAWSAPLRVPPGAQVPVLLIWRAAGPAPKDYNVFLHLRDAGAKDVALGDGQPTWFTLRPASGWQPGGDGVVQVKDSHTLSIPADLPGGRYELVVGWYDWQTGQRLSRMDGGNPPGDEFVLGAVTIDPAAGHRPDAVCLAAKESCASQE